MEEKGFYYKKPYRIVSGKVVTSQIAFATGNLATCLVLPTPLNVSVRLAFHQ